MNGNHTTADAAALVVAGLVLGVGRWADRGWSILRRELRLQVYPDGVDFEASASYHRLAGELFALPALLRQAHGLDVPVDYVERLQAMGRFTEAYMGPDGLAPFWGDADDGRALPLGGQDVSDHGSLPVLAASLAGERAFGNAEAAWLVGPDVVGAEPPPRESAAFRDGGAYVLRSETDHVFIDCGPIGLAGAAAATGTTTVSRSRRRSPACGWCATPARMSTPRRRRSGIAFARRRSTVRRASTVKSRTASTRACSGR